MICVLIHCFLFYTLCDYLTSLFMPDEYNANMILNLAVKVLRKEYLYAYLIEIFHEKKDLQEMGFFLNIKDIPLNKQEQIEVKNTSLIQKILIYG